MSLWYGEWYVVALVASLICLLVEIVLIERVWSGGGRWWKLAFLLSGWPLLFSVLFLITSVVIYCYTFVYGY